MRIQRTSSSVEAETEASGFVLAARSGPVFGTLAMRNSQGFGRHANSSVQTQTTTHVVFTAVVFATKTCPVVSAATQCLVADDDAMAGVQASDIAARRIGRLRTPRRIASARHLAAFARKADRAIARRALHASNARTPVQTQIHALVVFALLAPVSDSAIALWNSNVVQCTVALQETKVES